MSEFGPLNTFAIYWLGFWGVEPETHCWRLGRMAVSNG